VRYWLAQDSVLSRPHRVLLYQALLGGWPLDGPDETFASRIKAYATKALREGKQESSWMAPDAAYEQAAHDWIDARLGDADFRAAFENLAGRAALLGAAGSLAQLMLKATLPGLPDFYQGCELWDLSFVDPDNRRPVDYQERRRRLASLPPRPDWRGLCRDWRDGTVKLALTRKLLALRQAHPALFAEGDYRPLACRGRDADAVLAFSRSLGRHMVVTMVGRSCAVGSDGGRRWPRWSELDAMVELDRPTSFANALTGGLIYDRRLAAAELFDVLPGVVLVGD
jgi:(1->4)-alpha-D-glucan 1-alpha-D-glucosylmutase